jgi:DNA-binding XRE family transcriptional regulator
MTKASSERGGPQLATDDKKVAVRAKYRYYTVVMERTRAYSPRTVEAMRLLGARIRLARTRRRMTVEELGERVGVTHTTIRRIERGSLSVKVGIVFETASVLGVALFDEDPARVGLETRQVASDLALLPKRVRKPVVDDEF